MNSREKKSGNRMMNITKHSKNSKTKITSQLALTLPKKEGEFRVETNTSEHTIGEVLSQKQ